VEFCDRLKTDIINVTYYVPLVPRNSAHATAIANEVERYLHTLYYVDRKETDSGLAAEVRPVIQLTTNAQEV